MTKSPQLGFSSQHVFSNLMPNTNYQFEVEAKNEQNKTFVRTLTVVTKNIGKISFCSTTDNTRHHLALL